MRLQPKILLSIIPIVGAALVLTGWLVIKNATQTSHDAVFRYSEGILETYISQDLTQRASLLKANKLDKVQSFVDRYQKEALAAARKLNLIWPGHLFIIDGQQNILLCTSGEMPDKLPESWQQIRDTAIRVKTMVKGHLQDKSNDSYVAQYFGPWDWVLVITIKSYFLHEKDLSIWAKVALIGIITSIILVLSLGVALHKLVLVPVRHLREATDDIATNETPVTIPIKDKDEFGYLSRDIESMSNTIYQSKKDLQDAFEDLQSLNDMKTALIANVSHELRTPLTSILGFAKLGKRCCEKFTPDPQLSVEENLLKQEESIGRTLDIIGEQGECMAEMIDNIIMLMSLISEEKEVQTMPQDIVPLVHRVSLSHTMEAEAKSISLNIEAPSGPIPVKADIKLIETVLEHYISNAIAFTSKGSITVSVSRIDEEAVVKVQDTGCGMTEESKDHVFDQFYQAGDIMTEKPKGLGIGLSICRKIIELHHGRVWVESSLDQGTSFYFSLPIPSSN